MALYIDPNFKKIVFCMVDDIDSYATEEIKITIKNISDYTISNLHSKGYRTVIGKDENMLLNAVSNDYDYAVVMSPGTEYIDGYNFFNALDKLLEKDFFVAGHVLDRTLHDAYYELHHQCYVVNLAYLKRLPNSTVGVLEKNVSHTQVEPVRSLENWHDDYTPKSVIPGDQYRTYRHRCHGWNLLRLAFENKLPVLIFDEDIRNSKKHYYPESENDFYKNAEYIKYKFEYCKEMFVHTTNTEHNTGIDGAYEQIIIPASGTLYLDLIKQGRVIFYDYNQRALDFWKEHCPKKNNIEYVFVYTDLLHELSIMNYVDCKLKTLVNLSNIFCYEGTAAYYSLEKRLAAQNKLVEKLSIISDITITFSLEANAGHSPDNILI